MDTTRWVVFMQLWENSIKSQSRIRVEIVQYLPSIDDDVSLSPSFSAINLQSLKSIKVVELVCLVEVDAFSEISLD